ncbi:MAG: mandelate racemase/muconate lactonizing enzyme family protein [Chloroflexi bacterium]|nr:mandelate racemase/muconate lactonizing enzyme family protein [Chloroflexota bacterium]
MKIASVDTFHLRHRLSVPGGNSEVTIRYREALLVRIGTDDGLVGWGETPAQAGVRSIIERQMTPILLGRDPRQHRPLWRQLWGSYFGNGLAMGAVDIALHDLWGKALGVPVAELYGGRLRDGVPAYASTIGYPEGRDPQAAYLEMTHAALDRGFAGIKLRIGALPIEQDLALVRAAREVVGPDTRLMVDVNGGYPFATAVRVGRELERLGLYWYEEPLPPPILVGYEALSAQLDIAVAGGEHLESRAAFQAALDRRAVDIIQPDVSLCGGIAEALFVADLARESGVQAVPHCWGGGIVTAATLQLLALLPPPSGSKSGEWPMLELDVSESPFREELVTDLPALTGGLIRVPTGPGLGITVDEDVVRHYAVD